MIKKLVPAALIGICAIATAAWWSFAGDTEKSAETAASAFPPPRYPSYMVGDVSQRDLEFLGRSIARATRGGSADLGHIGVGQKGLIIHRDDQDMRIIHAAVKAVEERGGKVDYISRGHLIEAYGHFPPELVGVEPWIRPPVGDGVIESILQFGIDAFPRDLIERDYPELKQVPRLPPARMLEMRAQLTDAVRNALPTNWMTFPASEMAKLFLVDALWVYLQKHPGYDYYFAEFHANSAFRRIQTKLFGEMFKSTWRLKDVATTVAEGYMFPTDLRQLIAERSSQPVRWIESVHVADAEGTDLRFSVTPQEAEVWASVGGFYPASGTARIRANGEIPKPILPDAEGVIMGTINHKGVYPTMKLTIKHGMVQKIEGGGRVGTLFRTLLENEKIKNARYPGTPYPGFFYVWHYDLGNNPKAALDYRTISADLRRSGISAWGFGFESLDPKVMAYAGEMGLPFRHGFHVHQHYPTYEVTLRSRGQEGHKVKLNDRGHLTALDDAEVKALATRYGSPEEVLGLEWIPDTPGINTPGDYQKYRQDPLAHWQRRIGSLRTGDYPYMVKKGIPFVERGGTMTTPTDPDERGAMSASVETRLS